MVQEEARVVLMDEAIITTEAVETEVVEADEDSLEVVVEAEVVTTLKMAAMDDLQRNPKRLGLKHGLLLLTDVFTNWNATNVIESLLYSSQENILDLTKYSNKKIIVQFQGGRQGI